MQLVAPGSYSSIDGNETAATDPVAVVRRLLSVDDDALDYCAIKLAVDHVIDPHTDIAAARRRMDRLEAAARALAGPTATPNARFLAVRRVIYEPGAWNNHRAFAYDMDDPLGLRMANKLLANYLATGLGQCVSMPALFVILAERLGLDVAFALAPLHVFARFRDESGCWRNFEATNGHPARDEWYRQEMPMRDRAVDSGIYLRTLGKREGAAMLASVLLEHLFEECRYVDAVAAAQVILEHHPCSVHAMLVLGSACAHLLRIEFESRYRMPLLIPPMLRPRFLWLNACNRATFAKAQALGWEPVE